MTPNILDYMILFWLFICGVSGLQHGILRSLIGPVSLAASAAGSYMYFQNTHNLIGSLAGMLFGPILLSAFLSGNLHLWNTSKEGPKSSSHLSQFAGCVISVIWGALIITSLFLTVSIARPSIPRLADMYTKIIDPSQFYIFVEAHIKSRIPLVQKTQAMMAIAQDQKKMEKLEKQPSFENLYNDKKVQDALLDTELQALIKKQDLLALINHPKIKSLLQDERIQEKFKNFYSSIKIEE